MVVTSLNVGCLEAVAKGEVDAASNDLVNLVLMRKYSEHPKLYDIIDIGDRFDEKPYGIAVKKGRKSLVDLLNEAIESLKASGEIDRLLKANID
jgi:ABC-type amino acid transport substrate-binding protein